MSRETANVGLSLLLSIALVVVASLSARVYKETRDTTIAQAQMIQASQVACR